MTEDELLERIRQRTGLTNVSWGEPGAEPFKVDTSKMLSEKRLSVSVTCEHHPWCWCGAVDIANEPEECPECSGPLVISRGPGRVCRYRGDDYILPEWHEFPKCNECGAAWVTGDQIDRLSADLEEQRTRLLEVRRIRIERKLSRAERKRERAKKGTRR